MNSREKPRFGVGLGSFGQTMWRAYDRYSDHRYMVGGRFPDQGKVGLVAILTNARMLGGRKAEQRFENGAPDFAVVVLGVSSAAASELAGQAAESV
jgi:hypothetical protein